jgi:Lon protease-like protein
MSLVSIFPLPQVTLFPHALLPLHVFEPRYRDLLRDCMSGDKRMAIASLQPGYEAQYHGRPSVRPVCGLGVVVAHEELPDGRSNILLRGIGRMRILEELPPEHSYRVVRYQPLDDDYPAVLDRTSAQRELVLLCDQLALRLPSGGETLRELVRSQTDPGPLSDVLAAALVTEATDRQELLETLDVAARVKRVLGEVAEILTRFADHSGPAN